ncbi:zinc finger protein 664 isoform X3 [Castor canadensis]|uniref:Zinc finger protein 664 isoform X3 n=1 Tax=Castor canadensis TaxID=51338 RepID=A0AC58LJ99_CASCN
MGRVIPWSSFHTAIPTCPLEVQVKVLELFRVLATWPGVAGPQSFCSPAVTKGLAFASLECPVTEDGGSRLSQQEPFSHALEQIEPLRSLPRSHPGPAGKRAFSYPLLSLPCSSSMENLCIAPSASLLRVEEVAGLQHLACLMGGPANPRDPSLWSRRAPPHQDQKEAWRAACQGSIQEQG